MNISKIKQSFDNRPDLGDILAGRLIISGELCYDNSLSLLVCNRRDRHIPFGEGVCIAGYDYHGAKTERAYDCWFLRVDLTGQVQETKLDKLWYRSPVIQYLPDNSILIASGRCDKLEDGYVPNASLYSESGDLVRQLCLGNGLQRLLATPSGRIWASYNAVGTSEGLPALCRVDTTGKRLFDCDVEMYGCATVTTAGDGETIWTCNRDSLESDRYPVARITEDDSVTLWTNKFRHPLAIVPVDNFVLFYSGAGERYGKCVIQRCSDDAKLKVVATIELVLPDGKPIEKVAVAARGEVLTALFGTSWYQLSVRQLLNL